jgi:hypothetical protein
MNKLLAVFATVCLCSVMLFGTTGCPTKKTEIKKDTTPPKDKKDTTIEPKDKKDTKDTKDTTEPKDKKDTTEPKDKKDTTEPKDKKDTTEPKDKKDKKDKNGDKKEKEESFLTPELLNFYTMINERVFAPVCAVRNLETRTYITRRLETCITA